MTPRAARSKTFRLLVPAACLLIGCAIAPARADDPLPETPRPSTPGTAPDSPAPGFKVDIRPVRPQADTAELRRKREGIAKLVADADSALKARGGSNADNAQLFLSWNAPWGERRAQSARTPLCGDSTVADTLYLSMLTGRNAERFTGFTAQLLVHATGADTLGPWWHMESRGGENAGNMRIEWAGGSEWATSQPFALAGQGVVLLDHTRDNARLRMVYAVPYEQAGRVAAEKVYSLARIVLRHRPERKLVGCEQPVVVEWAEGTLAFGPKDEPAVRRGERFVAYSGPLALLEPYRGRRVETWKPKPKTAAR